MARFRVQEFLVGRTIEFDIGDHGFMIGKRVKVTRLKAAIARQYTDAKTGACSHPANRQKLIFCGKELTDDMRVPVEKILQETIVHMVLVQPQPTVRGCYRVVLQNLYNESLDSAKPGMFPAVTRLTGKELTDKRSISQLIDLWIARCKKNRRNKSEGYGTEKLTGNEAAIGIVFIPDDVSIQSSEAVIYCEGGIRFTPIAYALPGSASDVVSVCEKPDYRAQTFIALFTKVLSEKLAPTAELVGESAAAASGGGGAAAENPNALVNNGRRAAEREDLACKCIIS